MTEDRRPLKTRDARWAQAIAAALVRKRVSTNAISVAGLMCALPGGGALAMVPWSWISSHALSFTGAASAQLHLLCNMLDGMVVVDGRRKGEHGALFNESPDRGAGAGIAAGRPWPGWMAATVAVLTARVRTFGASLRRGHDFAGRWRNRTGCFSLRLAASRQSVIRRC